MVTATNMVDLDVLGRVAEGDGETCVRVTRRWLQAAFVELKQNRLAFDGRPLDHIPAETQ